MVAKKYFLGFLPLLVFYLTVCVFCTHRPLENDEWRYRGYAINLTEGFYAPPDTKHLWNGPGYPLFLSIFLLLKIPLIAAKYCNALFLFGAMLFVYRTLCFYTDERKAFWCAMLFGLYPPLLPELPRLLTESMSVLLICGFCYFLVKSFRQKQRRDILGAVFFGGYLILTKVIYAYVVTAGLGVSLMLSFWKRDYLRAALIYAGCLGLCLPYLIYTYSLTEKVFYWANSGGSTLYWMTTPYPGEWGDWRSEKVVLSDERYAVHRPFIETLEGKNFVEKDQLYKQKAIEQLREYPGRYVYNWVSNLGRLWLDYPFSYKYQRPHTLFYMFPNALLFGGFVWSACYLLYFIRRLPSEMIILGLFAVLFLAGSSLVYSCSRYLITIVPILAILICYCWTTLLKVQLRSDNPHA